ncbi:MAG: hypothetical protein ACHQ6U_10565 [Thermodesulfobacteriota bacterium]
MLICEIDRVRRAESYAPGSDPNSWGIKEESESGEGPTRLGDKEKLFTELQFNKIV